MGVYMRVVLREWHEPPFEEAAAFVAANSPFRLRGGWTDFEAAESGDDEAVLAGDLWLGEDAREELDELEAFLEDAAGEDAARDRVREHLRGAVAVVGMQILPSVQDASVAAANAVIGFLEQRPGVLTQVDTVGWYDGDELILDDSG